MRVQSFVCDGGEFCVYVCVCICVCMCVCIYIHIYSVPSVTLDSLTCVCSLLSVIAVSFVCMHVCMYV